ncbi:MAG: hypothetical protein U1F76_30480 [Candidatus Competibacteraceae bacterium]
MEIRNSFIRNLLLLGNLSLNLVSSISAFAQSSDYTSLKINECKKPSKAVVKTYASQGLAVLECPGLGGYRLFLVSSEERSWIDIARGKGRWSSEKDVVYQHQFGYFPNVASSALAEWRRNPAGQPVALIFRIAAQRPEADQNTPGSLLSRLVVIRLDSKRPCVLGVVEDNESARTLADSARDCPATANSR